jgi:hypothetical protein
MQNGINQKANMDCFIYLCGFHRAVIECIMNLMKHSHDVSVAIMPIVRLVALSNLLLAHLRSS